MKSSTKRAENSMKKVQANRKAKATANKPAAGTSNEAAKGPPLKVGTMTMRSNRNAHPGDADKPRPKRSSEQVAQDKARAALEKKVAVENRDAVLRRVAELQSEAERAAVQRQTNVHNPPTSSKAAQKVPRTRVVERSLSPDLGEMDYRPPAADDVFDNEGSDAGSEYEEGDDEGESEREDELLDDEDEEPAPKKQRGRKPARVRGDTRREVERYAAAMDVEDTGVGGRKRKLSAPEIKAAHSAAKRQRASQPHGLRTNWKSSRSSSTAVSSDPAPLRAVAFEGESSEYEDNEAFPSDEDDNDERVEAGQKAGKVVDVRKKASIAGIVKTEEETYVDADDIPDAVSLPKSKLTYAHLASNEDRALMKGAYDKRTKAYWGRLEPWTDIEEQEHVGSWNSLAVLYKGCNVAYGTETMQYRVVAKLGRTHITNLVHDIASFAIGPKCVGGFLGKLSADRTIAVVGEQLDGAERDATFYYEHVSYPDVEGQPGTPDTSKKATDKKGLLQGRLIASCFGYFCSQTSLNGALGPLDFDESDSATWPIGALVIVILAVKRALIYHRTGELVIPGGTAGHFSKQNWGDHEVMMDGVSTPLRTTSSILKLVKKLQGRHWVKIIAAAHAATASPPSPDVIDVDMLDADEESDYELRE
ncbi:hypothetical protein MKEN_01457500 [Mycena kentingensis (nom. inval.)]|nr:hypothetical protein MKEN_01457500 [Mycena kentingensis (nom. inval.)]